MSREAFEKWYAGYFGCEFGLNYHGDDDLERAWQAATEATKPKWIPVTESRDGANPDCPNGDYWICVEHKETKQREEGAATYYWAYGWLGRVLKGKSLDDWYIIARHPLPAPYVPEVSHD